MKRFTVIASFEKPIITEQDKIDRINFLEAYGKKVRFKSVDDMFEKLGWNKRMKHKAKKNQMSDTDKVKHILEIERAEKGSVRKIYNNVDDFLRDLKLGK